MDRRTLLMTGAASLLAGCAGRWEVDYAQGLDPTLTRGWTASQVIATVPDFLTVSNDNTYAPSADIVWHGEPFGDRKEQVAAILREAVTAASAPGPLGVGSHVGRIEPRVPRAAARLAGTRALAGPSRAL